MSSGVLFNNTNAVTSTAAGTAGQYLQSQGAGSAPTFVNFSLLVVALTSVTTTPYTVLTTDYYLSVATGTAKTIRLPNAPSTGRVFVIKDTTGSANSNNITVTTVGGVVTIDGSTSYTVNLAYGSLQLVFNGTSYEVY